MENNNNLDRSSSLQDQILNHISSLETLIKQHNEKAGTLITPIRLTFGEEGEGNKEKDQGKGPVEEVDEDLKRPYKEVLKSPFTRRIIEFSALNHRMPTNLKTLDGPARGWFDRMPNGCIDNWADLREKFVERFNLGRKCSKDPTEVSKIIRRANEMLPDFKEHWTEEMRYIQGVPEVMQISAFMSNSKCPELARRFADQVPQTVTEMMKRVDDFVKSEEAYKSTEFPKGEHPKKRQGAPYRGSRPPRVMQGGGPPKIDSYNAYNRRDHYQPYVSSRQQGRRGECQKRKFHKKREEDWMNAPITFPPILSDDVLDEPLIIEAEVEGYLVRRVFVDHDAAVQVMFEHCFCNLTPTVQARLTQTHTELVGFSGEQLLPIGRIELEVMFGSEGLCRRTMMKFTVVQASSPYNIILGRTGMRELRAISSITHAMMKFPTPRGIATLVPWTAAIFEC
ncbi:reverse transcriptase domain-containing protein [Tanacetum coccineum]